MNRVSTPRGPRRAHAPAAPEDPTRDIAFDILVSVLEHGGRLEEALDRVPSRVSPRDRGAAHRLAATVLRRLGTLDAVLEPLLPRGRRLGRPPKA